MAAQDWRVLGAIGMHTLTDGGAIVSFVVLTRLTKWGISAGVLRTILEGIQGVVLIVLVLIFAYNVIYDVLPEQLRSAIYDLAGRLRNVFTSKLVLA
jgi:uncharacterized membrane protein